MCWGWRGCCEVFIYLVVHNKTFNFSLPLKTLFHFQSVAPEGFHSLWYNRKLKIKNWFSVLAEFDASMCQEQRGSWVMNCVPSKSTGGVKVILAHFTDRSLSHSLLAGLAMLCLTKFFLIQLQSERVPLRVRRDEYWVSSDGCWVLISALSETDAAALTLQGPQPLICLPGDAAWFACVAGLHLWQQCHDLKCKWY